MEFVFNMDIDALFRKMNEDLHIFADLVEVWIVIRRERMMFTEKMMGKLEEVKKQVALFHLAIEKEKSKEHDQEDD